jgi:ribonuclease HII
MDATGLTLAALRARCLAAREADERERWLVVLRQDARSGARALASALERRVRAEQQEQARLRGLFALRARRVGAGARSVAGVDEVGMGPLAGPVLAAAVMLGDAPELPGLDDSKRLSRAARERLASRIHEQALAVGVGRVEPEEIDRSNIYRAGLEAMRRAVLALVRAPDHVLVDARTIPGLACAQTAIVGGDARDASIAAASIVAKVARDAIMCRLDERHPGWGLAQHMGYPTPQHLAALRRLGPSPVHRRSFAPVARVAADFGR